MPSSRLWTLIFYKIFKNKIVTQNDLKVTFDFEKKGADQNVRARPSRTLLCKFNPFI